MYECRKDTKDYGKTKKTGLVETKEGIDGGYLFVKNSEETDLCTIADALEFSFVTSGWKSGSSEMKCLIASGMAGVMEDVYKDLDQQCRRRLRQITIADLDKQIFKT